MSALLPMPPRPSQARNAGTARSRNKEALAIMFALNKVHQFLYGHSFILVTDHKPLIVLFRLTKATLALAANRLARWALTLSLQLDPTDPGAMAKESAKDPVIANVMRFTRDGWPPKDKREASNDGSNNNDEINWYAYVFASVIDNRIHGKDYGIHPHFTIP